ncbi:ComF family protein [Thermus caliditerrae]|uniref:ComF family protein n=1 Tax=Thermus caliditerrae TaxID=1330700 RepID=UPI001F224634|nr:hypothetical protein [Thermus caliditerrae]
MSVSWPIGTVFLTPTEDHVRVLMPEDLATADGRALSRWPLVPIRANLDVKGVYVRGLTPEPLGPNGARSLLRLGSSLPPVACNPDKVPRGGLEVRVLDLHTLPNRDLPERYVRTPVGELLYRLKYGLKDLPEAQARWQAAFLADRLAATLAHVLREEPLPVQAVVPAPYSLERPWQPLLLVAEALGRLLRVPVVPALHKADGVSVKNLPYEERHRVLARAVRGESRGVPEKVLLLDDLLESGATLEVSAEVLRQLGAREVWPFALTVDRRAL